MNKLCPVLSTNFHFPETTSYRLFASTWFRISQIQAFLKNVQIQASQEESVVRKNVTLHFPLTFTCTTICRRL